MLRLARRRPVPGGVSLEFSRFQFLKQLFVAIDCTNATEGEAGSLIRDAASLELLISRSISRRWSLKRDVSRAAAERKKI